MKRFIVVFAYFFLFYPLVSCKKSKTGNDESAALSPVTFAKQADLPYDTTNIDGVFATNILLDTATTSHEGLINFTAWFTKRLSDGFADSAVIIANGRTLLQNGHNFATATDKFIPPVGYRADTPVAWIMNGNSPADFTYANSDPFPSYNGTLPDTISITHNTFSFSAANTANADTVMLKFVVPLGADSSTSLNYYASPVTGIIAIDSTIIKSLSNKSIGLFINVFSHKQLTLKGHTYFFIKEYSYGRNVWVK